MTDQSKEFISAKMISRKITVINELGIHLRTAGMIAKLAQNAKSKVWLIKNDQKVDASNIIDIISLECPCGTKITFQINNMVDFDVLNNLVELAENGFGE